MKVAVTGVAGFIGSTLADRLLADGHQVVGIDSFTSYYGRADKERNLLDARRHPSFRLVEADLRSGGLAALFAGCDAVVNQAAAPGLVLGWDRLDAYAAANLDAVQHVAAACLAAAVPHLVQASTSSVYGSVAAGPEDGPTAPVSPYGVTKLAAEHVLHAHGEVAGLPYTILRYFSVYGPRQRPDMAYRVFAERLLAGRPLTVYGDGRQTRTNTYVDDCVAATVAALERAPDGATFNIGGGTEIALLDAIGVLGDALGVVPVVDHQGPREGDQLRTAADTRRARDLLGWAPETDPAEGLAREATWVRALRRD